MNLFISVSNPEESRQVSQKLDSLGYNKHHSFRDTESYIKVYREEKDYSSFDNNDDGFWGRDCERITAAEFLTPAARGLPECFYVNIPTESLAQAVVDKLKSLGHVDCCSGSDAKTGRVFSFKDKSFFIHSKDYIVTHPYKITEEVSLDLLFSRPDPPVETEIPGILTGDYTLFKKENGDFSIREYGKEILIVSAENVARIKEEVEKFNNLSAALPTSFSVHVPVPELSEIVQKRLFELGFISATNIIERTGRPYINVSDKCFSRNFDIQHAEISISSLWKPRESVVLPGLVPGYNVIIGENGVKIGCQAVSFEEVLAFF